MYKPPFFADAAKVGCQRGTNTMSEAKLLQMQQITSKYKCLYMGQAVAYPHAPKA